LKKNEQNVIDEAPILKEPDRRLEQRVIKQRTMVGARSILAQYLLLLVGLSPEIYNANGAPVVLEQDRDGPMQDTILDFQKK
jgi:hypothetical protein